MQTRYAPVAVLAALVLAAGLTLAITTAGDDAPRRQEAIAACQGAWEAELEELGVTANAEDSRFVVLGALETDGNRPSPFSCGTWEDFSEWAIEKGLLSESDELPPSSAPLVPIER